MSAESPNPPPPYDLVIFDCDGVLVDSEGLSENVIIRLMAEIGVDMTPDDVHRLSHGLSDRDMWLLFEREYRVSIPNELIARFDQEELVVMRAELEATNGVEAVVRSLFERGQPICVASSGTKAKMSVTLAVTGLEPYFRGNIFSASQVERGKPAPDLFLFAAESMAENAESCVVIEDSRNGVLAGLAAGMTVFGFTPDTSPALLDDLGIQLFPNMSELPALLRV